MDLEQSTNRTLSPIAWGYQSLRSLLMQFNADLALANDQHCGVVVRLSDNVMLASINLSAQHIEIAPYEECDQLTLWQLKKIIATFARTNRTTQ